MVFFFIFIFLYISLLLYIYSPSVFLILPATHVFPFSASHCWLCNIFLGSCSSFICFSFIFSWLVWYCAFFTDALPSIHHPHYCFEFTRALFSLCSMFIFSLCVLPQFLSSCHLVCFLLPLSFELYQHAKNGLLCCQIIHVKDIPLNLEISTKCFCGHRIQICVHAVS